MISPFSFFPALPPRTADRPARTLPRRWFALLAATFLLPLAALSSTPQPAQAQDPFLGEVRMFAGNFAPRGWAFCEGQLLSINQNSDLFSLLGTTFGGDGQTTFALPDLRGRVPLHPGTGPGLSPHQLGQKGGTEMTSLTAAQMPSHSHAVKASDANGSAVSPAGLVPARNAAGVPVYGPPTLEHLAGNAIEPAGGGQPHDNMQPYLGLNYIIALQGLYPSRN